MQVNEKESEYFGQICGIFFWWFRLTKWRSSLAIDIQLVDIT